MWIIPICQRCKNVIRSLHKIKGHYIHEKVVYFHITAGSYNDLFSVHSDHLAEQLWQASSDGHESEVLELLQRGVPPDSEYYKRANEGRSPLFISCWHNHPLSAEYLLKWGASLITTTDWGSTPLHASYNSMDCVRLLLEHRSPASESE